MIKYMISTDSDFHMITIQMPAERMNYFYLYESTFAFLLHYSIRYGIYIEIGFSKYAVIQNAQLFHVTGAVFSKPNY